MKKRYLVGGSVIALGVLVGARGCFHLSPEYQAIIPDCSKSVPAEGPEGGLEEVLSTDKVASSESGRIEHISHDINSLVVVDPHQGELALPEWEYSSAQNIGTLTDIVLQASEHIDWKDPDVPPGPIHVEYYQMRKELSDKRIKVRPVMYSDGSQYWTFWIEPKKISGSAALGYDGSMMNFSVDPNGRVTKVESRPQLHFDAFDKRLQPYLISEHSFGDVFTMTRDASGAYQATTQPLVLQLGGNGVDLVSGYEQPIEMHKQLPWAFQKVVTNLQDGYAKIKK